MLTTLVSRTRKSESGLTLIEMVAAVVVFGILVAIAVPIFLHQREKGVETQIDSVLTNAVPHIEQARLSNGSQYPTELPPSIGAYPDGIDGVGYAQRESNDDVPSRFCLAAKSGDKMRYATSDAPGQTKDATKDPDDPTDNPTDFCEKMLG